MELLSDFFANMRKPKGICGKLIISMMNFGHKKAHLWGIKHLPEKEYASILDLGCGGGACAKLFLEKYPAAKVTALDYAKISVEKTIDLNREAVDAGRLEVLESDVSQLPLATDSFDLVTAFETIYFWPGPVKSFKEVCRVLKPGGIFLIVNEADSLNPSTQKWVDLIKDMNIYNKEELKTFLKTSGFHNIKAVNEKGNLCIIAEKSEPA